VHLPVDSAGLKLCGAGEWRIEKHGTKTRCSWRRLHIGMNANTGKIIAAGLTANDVEDASSAGHRRPLCHLLPNARPEADRP
jgi:hypothetical protein